MRLLSLMIIVLFAGAIWGDDLVADKQERTFAVQTHPELSVRNSDGHTIVRAHEGSDIIVRYTKKVRHAGSLDKAKKEAEDVNVRVEQIGNRVEAEVKYPHNIHIISFGTSPSVSVDFEILVPAASDVQVKTSDGDTEIDGIQSRADLSASDGNISIRNCAGELHVDTSDGDIQLQNCSGTVAVKVADGNVSVENCSGTIQMKAGDSKVNLTHVDGSLNLDAGDGSVQIDGKFQQLALKVSGADLKVNVENGSVMQSAWRIKSSDGNVALQLPQDFSANLDISSNDGKIITAIPISVTGRLSESKLSGKLNEGGQVFEIQTSDGNIEIK